MTSSSSNDDVNLFKKKGSWTPEEEAKLIQLVETQGARNWSVIGQVYPEDPASHVVSVGVTSSAPTSNTVPSLLMKMMSSSVHTSSTETSGPSFPSSCLVVRTTRLRTTGTSTLRRRGLTLTRSSESESTQSDDDDDGLGKNKSRRCVSVSDVSSCHGMTVLTLLPSSDGEKKKGDDEVEKGTVEIEDTCLVDVMKKMIAKEVRTYIDELRAKDGLSFGPTTELDLCLN